MPYGAVLVMAAAVLWGTTGTAQAVASYDGSPLPLGSARLVVAGLVFAGILAARGARKVPWRAALTSRRTVAVVLLGAACVAAYQPAFFHGVQRTGVGVGTLTAIGSAPVFAGLGALLAGHRPGRLWWLSTATVLVGLGLLLRGGGALHVDLAGVLACLVAGAAYAAYTATSRWLLLAGVPPTTVLAFLFAGGAALLLVSSPAANIAWLTRPDNLWLALYLGVVATALPYLLWVAGLASVRTSTAATLSLTEPLTAALLGWLLLDEPVTSTGLAGAGLVIAGLAATAVRRSPVPASSP
ncbi:EamA family transporter [Phytohabitans sp. ZYX-F-186]|uniref:EamA family transporter n=1 Tax=Phytohabitans maris TaxID=3071409 RepID=A0ABU0ZPF7_9ACTN|nr:EamA family transporter [Phytohabitans sp. ZYX-F-186]MDQ7908924.1 EamA family transporter [Phytohabitans sp. ZYX-F-186]